MTHTPTPWGLCHHLKSPEHDASCKCGYRGSIWSADGEYIILEMGSSPDVDETGAVMGHTQPQADRPTQLADAAFIVKATAAYDKHRALIETLVDALKLFVRAEKMARDGNPPQDADKLIEIGDAALSAAKEITQ